MTGPILFADPTAREQLLTTGVVHTVRAADRTVGETWTRWTRTGEKTADVTLEEIESNVGGSRADLLESLSGYWKLSGFDSAAQWVSAVEDAHGTTEGLSIYRCELEEMYVDPITELCLQEEGSA